MKEDTLKLQVSNFELHWLGNIFLAKQYMNWIPCFLSFKFNLLFIRWLNFLWKTEQRRASVVWLLVFYKLLFWSVAFNNIIIQKWPRVYYLSGYLKNGVHGRRFNHETNQCYFNVLVIWDSLRRIIMNQSYDVSYH